MEFKQMIGIIWVFEHMPKAMLIGALSALLMFINAFYAMVISPIIFNYFIIPNIEKKVGKNLEYHSFISYIFLGMWMCRQNEIAIYLINRYLAMKFKNEFGLPKFCLRFGLRKVGYTIDMATKFEIIMSFLLIISFIITVICGIVVFIISKCFPEFTQ